jgi:hypothetical protein
MITHIILSLVIIAVVYVIVCVYYLNGFKRGYDIGFYDGVDSTQKIITQSLRNNTMTLDGKKIRLVEDVVEAPPSSTTSNAQSGEVSENGTKTE